MLKIKVIGQLRTNNFKDGDVAEKIKNLWTEVMKKIKDKKDMALYGVYTEYESNYRGDYTLFIGSEEAESKEELIIEEDKFHIFNVDTSKENGVAETWQKIWNLEKDKKINRAYTVDFEKYYPDGKIEIYIALK